MSTPSERLKKSVTKDNLWIYILSLLKERELYPYEIRRLVKQRFGFSPGRVTAYIVLKKLENKGYVKKWKTIKTEGPERNYYKITLKGCEEIKKGESILKAVLKLFK